MPIRYLDEEPTKVSKIRYLDESPEEAARPEQDLTGKLAGAAIDFTESSLGIGDEAGGFGSELGLAAYDLFNTDKPIGDILSSFSMDRGIDSARDTLDTFEEQNPTLSKVITGAGLVTGLAVPGATGAKILRGGSNLAKTAKFTGMGAAEGAAYGALAGRDEGRLESAGIGAAIGGPLGAVASRFVRTADEVEALVASRAVKKAGAGTHIGGDDGFADVGKVKESRDTAASSDTSTRAREVEEVTANADVSDAEFEASALLGKSLAKKVSDGSKSIALATREWIVDNVGERAARLAEDAETSGRIDYGRFSTAIDDTLAGVDDWLAESPQVAAAINNLGGKAGITFDTVRKMVAGDPKKVADIDELERIYEAARGRDFDVMRSQTDWVHRESRGLNVAGRLKGDVRNYEGPVAALKKYAEEVSTARALADRFGIDTFALSAPKKGQSRVDAVINEIERAAKEQGATADVAANLANGLRTQFIRSKSGANAAGALMRKATSAGLLANPMNAALNVAEGITAPIYQNGIKAWAKSVLPSIKSTMREQFGDRAPNWLSQKDMGLGDSFMGEVAQEATSTVGTAVDTMAKFLYKVSGVSTVNRMGQEILQNSAVIRGRDLAKKGIAGDAKAVEKLRKHDGMRGLTESEFQATMKELGSGNVDSPWINNFAGAALNKWQPVSAASMPKAFHDNPNGRMMYSMMSYMNRQMNSLRLDVGSQIAEANRYGLNTKEGRQALKNATKASAKYVALFGVVGGLFDDSRKTMLQDSDYELSEIFTPEGITDAALNQIVSNVSSGMLNMRASDYGGKAFNPVPAPASVGMKGVNAAYDLATGQGSDSALRFLQGNVPGFSLADKTKRMFTDERLLIDPKE